MKYALISYSRGKQKEVNADDYRNKYVYSYEKFICPECGEDVSLVRSDSNFFRHHKKTSTSLDCSLRVEKPSLESIYERVGLPMYIRKKSESTFSLYIGFKALPSNIFNQAVSDKMSLSINNKKYMIDYSRFSTESITYIPVDYMPNWWGGSYTIQYNPPEKAGVLKQYWPDFCDGFHYYGALFTVTSQGGRKIRHGDIVATDTEYYWVCNGNIPTYLNGISMTQVGELDIQQSSLYVYKVFFRSDISDYEYERLAAYLRQSLKVHLLEKQPEFQPLWPPMVKTEDGYRTHNRTKYVHGHVVSGNDEVKIYIFGGTDASPEEQFQRKRLVCLPMFRENTFINVDRKFASNGLSITKNLTTISSHQYEVKIGKENDLFALADDEFDYEDTNITIECDKKMQIILFKDSNKYELYDLKRDENYIAFSALHNGDCIYILHRDHLIKKVNIVLPHISKATQSQLAFDFNILWAKYKDAKQVYIPEKIRRVLLELRQNCEKNDAEIIKKIIQSNMIPLPILRLLEG